MRYLTLSEVAQILSLSPVRVRQLAQIGRLRASKVGDRWVVTEREVQRFAALRRAPGRPSLNGRP